MAKKRNSFLKAFDRVASKAGYVSTQAAKRGRIRVAGRHPEEFTPQQLRDGSTIPGDFTTLLEVYGNSAWVYASVFAISSHIAAVPIRFYKMTARGKKAYLPPSHWLYSLFNQPNEYTSGYDMMEGTVSYLELNGNAYWEKEFVVGEDGQPGKMYLLRSDKVRPVPHPKTRVSGYKYDISTTRALTFNADEVLQYRYFNPLTELYGLSPMQAAIAAVTMDFWAVGNEQDLFRNGSKMSGVLEVADELSDPAYKRIEEHWAQGFKGVGKGHKTLILENGLKFNPMSITPRDMEFVNLRKMSRDEILAVYGVPPIIVGVTEKTPWANAKEQRREFWYGTLIPKMNKIESALNSEFIMSVAPGVRAEFDLTGVQALMEDLEKQAVRLGGLVQHGILTINDSRKIMGYPEVPWGDTWWTPANLVPYLQSGGGLPELGTGDADDITTTTGEDEDDSDIITQEVVRGNPDSVEVMEELGNAMFTKYGRLGLGGKGSNGKARPGSELPALVSLRNALKAKRLTAN